MKYWKTVLPIQGQVVFVGGTWHAARERARAFFIGDEFEPCWREMREIEPEEIKPGDWVNGEPYEAPGTKHSKSQKNGRKK